MRACKRNAMAGFTLIEALIAMGLVLCVTAAVFAVLTPAQSRFGAELETADMEQRLRVAADVLRRDLMMAGAGGDFGRDAGALTGALPPIMPARHGAVADDPPGTVRSDTITLLYVPPAASQSTLTTVLGPGQLTMGVAQAAGCPANKPACGFSVGMTVLVHDRTGGFDTFRVTAVDPAGVQLKVNRPGNAMQATYPVGSPVFEVVQRTYYLKPIPADATSQLMRYDGSTAAGVPVADHIVSLRFEYFGTSAPPQVLRPVSEPNGPWTTYGPPPPEPPDSRPPFAAGENCSFFRDAGTGLPVPRPGSLGAAPLAALTAGQLSDGDFWCPDAANARRYDVDLFRIRKVGVTLRVQAASPAFRGTAGALFTNAGFAKNGHALLPDREVHFEVSPRNLTFAY